MPKISIWDHMLLIISFITVSTCNPHLVIVRNDHNDVTTPHTIVATVGSNLSLTCKLEGIQDFHTKIVWGRRTNELKFENAADLKELALKNPTQILAVRNQYNPHGTDTAIKSFVPLKLTDRGTYFCMNWKYILFKIVRIKVVEDIFIDEEIICTRDRFKCEDGEKCIQKSKVCDHQYHCTDLSDEKWPRCPCRGIVCGDECIPTKLCCDINTDPDCFIPKRHSCCPPLVVVPDDDSYIVTDIKPTNYSPLNIFLFIISAVVVLTVCVVLYYGVKQCKANEEASDSNNENGIPVPIIRTNDNDNTMILTTLMNNASMNNSREYLDLPPTYHDSTRNSPQSSFHNSLEDIAETVINDCSSPPSYDEALANLTSSVPSLLNEADATSGFLEVPLQNIASRGRTT